MTTKTTTRAYYHCTSRYSAQVRCEGRRGHEGPHGHSFFARYWTDEDRPTCLETRRDIFGRLMACALPNGHRGQHVAQTGATLRGSKGY